MQRAPGSPLRGLALATGALLCLGYFVWQWREPHGAFEFAYGPLTLSLPYSPMRGFTYEQLWGHVRRVVLLGPGLALGVWGAAGWLRPAAPRDLRRVTWICCGLCLAAIALVMLVVLRGRALIDDELVYAMQAGFLLDGRLTGFDVGSVPREAFTVQTLSGYTGKYLLGEALVQTLGVAVGLPALLHLPVVGATLWAFHRALALSSGPRFALLGTAALACSPMLIFTSATGLSHASALMWVVLLGLAVELARAGRTLPAALLAGVSFGLGLWTRPQSLVPTGAVLGLALCFSLWRRRAFAAIGLAGLLACTGAAALLLYNRALTGSPLQLPWFLVCDPEHFGFGRVWRYLTYVHTPLAGLENVLVVAARLNAWWLGLPLSLGVIAVWLATGRRTAGASLWLWVGAAVVAFELFYYSPGASDTGAIYHYELLLPGAVIAAAVAERVLSLSYGPLALLIGLVLGTGSWLVEQGFRVERLVTYVHQDSETALAQLEAPALLLHETRPSESVPHGWVSGFPRRFRRPSDGIVTWPRSGPETWSRLTEAYPGRSCFYFHYLPGTAVPRLLSCAEAAQLLERPRFATDDVAAFVVRPTAYFESSFLPAAEAAALRARDQGLPGCVSQEAP
jgi:hypothetical protein